MNAHERAKQEAKRFLRKHPEFENSNQPRLDSGETAVREDPWDIRMGGQRVMVGQDYLGSEGAQVPPTTPVDIEKRVLSVRVERLIELLPEDKADLLRRVYWERQPRTDIATDFGISHQAVTSRVRTAERAFLRALKQHGGDAAVLDVGPEDL